VGTSLKALLRDVRLDEPGERTEGAREGAPAKRPVQKKRSARQMPAAPPAPAPPAEARPSDTLRGEDRIAYFDAYAGVKPIGGKPRAVPGSPAPAKRAATPPAKARADDEARDRLAALVAGGVRFELEREDERIRGRRAGTPPRVAEALERRGVVPEATLDLHGHRAAEAERAVVRFVRRQHNRGARRVCVVHGKGLHSDGGVGVLRDRVVHALTEGGAAPVVKAFATAPPHLGGSGALMVELT
jgi:DNA-nicking Smr family endonuclease